MKPQISRPALAARAAAAVALGALVCACASHPKPPPIQPPPRAPSYSQGTPYGGVQNPQVQTSPLPGSEKDFVINVGDRVYFDYDKADIRADATPVLASQAGWLVRYPSVDVRIEGNCDERGTQAYNFALGARRAVAVRQFLIEHGVNGGRIATISYGKERPIDPGTGDAAWARNRNAHTAIVSGAAPSS